MTTLKELYDIYVNHPEVTTDSRRVTTGSLFFALRGERFNGNDYATKALEAGAAYAVVDNPDLKAHPRMLYVSNVLETLQQLAAHHRAQLGLPILAITGTNGKTTTKELCAAVLSRNYRLLYTEGNLNNHIGVPLTLLRLREDHQLAIIEMGASKRGDIQELCSIAQPNYGIITNIGVAHLEGFGSVEQITLTKCELYDWLRTHEGKAFLLQDDAKLGELIKGIPNVPYGFGSEAVVRGELCSSDMSPYLSISWSADCIGVEPHKQQTQLIGNYNAPNVLSAVSVGLFFDVPTEQIQEAIEMYNPTNNRSQLIVSEHNQIIADAYNANPISMQRALESFAALVGDKKGLIILGSMRELGTESEKFHREIVDLVNKQYPNYRTYYCGTEWYNVLEGRGQYFIDVSALREHLNTTPPRGLYILIKGSNSIGLSSILPLL